MYVVWSWEADILEMLLGGDDGCFFLFIILSFILYFVCQGSENGIRLWLTYDTCL